MNDLKPCPCCGATVTAVGPWQDYDNEIVMLGSIECPSCGLSIGLGGDMEYAEVIRRWNSRIAQPAPDPAPDPAPKPKRMKANGKALSGLHSDEHGETSDCKLRRCVPAPSGEGFDPSEPVDWQEVRTAPATCNHVWGIDSAHSNEYCKKCFISRPDNDPRETDPASATAETCGKCNGSGYYMHYKITVDGEHRMSKRRCDCGRPVRREGEEM